MAVDDDNITSLIEKTNLELTIIGSKRDDLRQLLNNLNKINKPVDPNDDTKRIMPKDKGVGGDMTLGRRQGMYDKAVADAATLGL
ncbi:hypothetical protein LCGC14_0372670 [marine sediment metagenome]|uniref:Uncharacterized protein n=1 Tax=marine sediment metagenome TaxID=412755 RepID=A0A0F9VRX2_9ZZZZ